MQITEKIKELEKELPHGSKKNISETTGLDIRTVINFFKLRSVKLENQHKIINEAKKIIQDIKTGLTL